MGKIMDIKTRQKRASILGFSYLHGSMLEYADGFTSERIAEICYDLYIAYIDSMRWDFPDVRFEEGRKKYFIEYILLTSKQYRTSVQLYKALDYLLDHITDACLKAKQLKTVQEMRRYAEEKAAFFHAMTGVPLRSHSTVYHACAYSLIPARNEPRHVFFHACERRRNAT